jgi:hypothetical protein
MATDLRIPAAVSVGMIFIFLTTYVAASSAKKRPFEGPFTGIS